MEKLRLYWKHKISETSNSINEETVIFVRQFISADSSVRQSSMDSKWQLKQFPWNMFYQFNIKVQKEKSSVIRGHQVMLL